MTLNIRKSLKSRSGGSMKVGTKIFALVGFCLSLLVLVAGTGIYEMQKVGDEIVGIAERDLPLTKGLTQVVIHQFEQIIADEIAFRAGETMAEDPRAREDFDDAVATFTELSEKIEIELEELAAITLEASEASTSAEEHERFQSILEVLGDVVAERRSFDQSSREAFRLIAGGNLNRAHAIIPEIEEQEEKLEHWLDGLLLDLEASTLLAAETVEKDGKFALVLMLTITIIALIVGTGAAFFLIRKSITRPLDEVVTGINALISGDLSLEVEVYNDDEIGAVAKAYATFRENLIRTNELEQEQEERRIVEEKRNGSVAAATSDFVANIGNIIDTMASATSNLQTTAQSMSSIAEETSSQANSVAAASEEASANVQTVASATEEMSNSIAEISSQVTDASKASKTAVDNVTKTAAQMDTLAKTADKIGEVVSMISEIAEQTNLLSLNATIEAARAGEAGKGFAVVASEVKALADETAKATEGISRLVHEIQTATGNAVTSISEIGTDISRVNETSTAIAAAMEEQGAATQEIARNVSEAAAGTQVVSSNIAGVTKASQETGEASERVSSSAAELSKQGTLLKSRVDKFLEQIKAA